MPWGFLMLVDQTWSGLPSQRCKEFMDRHLHCIRLLGPWEYAWADSQGPEATWQRIHLPVEKPPWLETACGNWLLLRRWFHRPSGLGPKHHLRIRLDHLPLGTQVWLNQNYLGTLEGQHLVEFPQSALRLRNELILQVPASQARSWSLWAGMQVALEIEEPP